MSEKKAIMPYADYVAACDALRARSGKSDSIASGALAAEINEAGREFVRNMISHSLVTLSEDDLKGVEYIGNYAFYNNTFEKIELPEGIRTIGGSAFGSCEYLTELILPASLEAAYSGLVSNCSALKKVIFCGTPTSLPSAFYGTPGGLEIFVPWAEGEGPSGAPWGAAGATIHYNSEV